MKTIRCLITTLFLSFFLISNLWAQQDSCYVRLEDASGYTPTSDQVAELEAAAADLCAVFDSVGFSGQFKVYDFGFYLHQEVTEGGYPEPFAKKIQEVQDSSPYYLLFGKQTDRQKGVYVHFWVKAKLPSDSLLSCIIPAKERLFEANVSQIVNNKYIQLKQDYNLYHKAEIVGMMNLKNTVDSIRKGNCCPITSNQIKPILLSKGYESVPAKFVEIPISAKTQKKQSQSFNLVADYAELLCEMQGVSGYEDFSISIEEEMNKATVWGIAARGYITKNENLCESIGEQIMTGFENSGDDAFIHLHFSPSQDSSKPGDMFVKFKQTEIPEEDLPEIVITAPYNECGPVPLPPTNQTAQTYAITKGESHYSGYHLLNGQWLQSDSVEFFVRTPFSGDDGEWEYRWNDKGAFRENLGSGFGYRYHPSFLGWWWTEGPIAEEVAPTPLIEFRFHFFFQKSIFFRSEKNKVFQCFKYPKLYSPSSYLSGGYLHWDCDSELSRGLHELDVTKNEIERVENIIKDWLLNHEDLDSLFIGGEYFIDGTDNIGFESLSSSLWAAQIFGGTQGRKIQVKKFQKIQPPSLGMFTRGYEVEFIFTVYDNFGVGKSDGGKWFLPGVIEQWVLQHYRNYDCDNIPCYIPIIFHTAEIFHRLWIWIPN